MKFFSKNDFGIISVVLTVAAVCFLALHLWAGKGRAVSVTVDGRLLGTYSLEEALTLSIDGVGGTNRFGIEDGEASISAADCPDGLCVKKGKVNRRGESIICLPHRVVVKVLGGENEYDAIAR